MSRDEISKLVLASFANTCSADAEDSVCILNAITESSIFYEKPLYADSLDALAIISNMESEFEIEIPWSVWENSTKISDFIDFIDQRLY